MENPYIYQNVLVREAIMCNVELQQQDKNVSYYYDQVVISELIFNLLRNHNLCTKLIYRFFHHLKIIWKF